MTSTVDVKDETRSRPIQKAKVKCASHVQCLRIFKFNFWTFFLLLNLCPGQIEILLGKTEKFDELMAAADAEREAAEAEEQSKRLF